MSINLKPLHETSSGSEDKPSQLLRADTSAEIEEVNLAERKLRDEIDNLDVNGYTKNLTRYFNSAGANLKEYPIGDGSQEAWRVVIYEDSAWLFDVLEVQSVDHKGETNYIVRRKRKETEEEVQIRCTEGTDSLEIRHTQPIQGLDLRMDTVRMTRGTGPTYITSGISAAYAARIFDDMSTALSITSYPSTRLREQKTPEEQIQEQLKRELGDFPVEAATEYIDELLVQSGDKVTKTEVKYGTTTKVTSQISDGLEATFTRHDEKNLEGARSMYSITLRDGDSEYTIGLTEPRYVTFYNPNKAEEGGVISITEQTLIADPIYEPEDITLHLEEMSDILRFIDDRIKRGLPVDPEKNRGGKDKAEQLIGDSFENKMITLLDGVDPTTIELQVEQELANAGKDSTTTRKFGLGQLSIAKEVDHETGDVTRRVEFQPTRFLIKNAPQYSITYELASTRHSDGHTTVIFNGFERGEPIKDDAGNEIPGAVMAMLSLSTSSQLGKPNKHSAEVWAKGAARKQLTNEAEQAIKLLSTPDLWETL